MTLYPHKSLTNLFFCLLVIRVAAHGIDKKFSHEPAIGAVRIAFDSYSVGLHLGDNEMRTAGFERSLDRGNQSFFVAHRAGVGDARALGDFFQIGLRVVNVEPMRA